jgi:hypothetical protein
MMGRSGDLSSIAVGSSMTMPRVFTLGPKKLVAWPKGRGNAPVPSSTRLLKASASKKNGSSKIPARKIP